MAKVDLKSAFRMVPIQVSEWELLCMYWRGQYYIDTCLPFGLLSAPSIFNNFASALHCVLENNYGANLLHYLDDFLLVGPPDQPTLYLSGVHVNHAVRRCGSQWPRESVKVQRPALPSWTTFWIPPCGNSDCHQRSCRTSHASLIKSWLGECKATNYLSSGNYPLQPR